MFWQTHAGSSAFELCWRDVVAFEMQLKMFCRIPRTRHACCFAQRLELLFVSEYVQAVHAAQSRHNLFQDAVPGPEVSGRLTVMRRGDARHLPVEDLKGLCLVKSQRQQDCLEANAAFGATGVTAFLRPSE